MGFCAAVAAVSKAGERRFAALADRMFFDRLEEAAGVEPADPFERRRLHRLKAAPGSGVVLGWARRLCPVTERIGYDDAPAATVIDRFRPEAIRWPGPWRGLELAELAALERGIDRLNAFHLREPIGNIRQLSSRRALDIDAAATAA